MHGEELNLDKFKDDFLNIFFFFLHPQIPHFQILSDHNKPYLFSFQMMHESKFVKPDT